MRMGKNTARRGIGLVEVVIAIAIIMIVSAGAVGLLLQASQAEGKVADTMERNEQVENVIECYQWSKGYTFDFKSALGELYYEPDAEDETLFVLEKTNYTVRVQIYMNEGGDAKMSGIEISVVNMDSEEIYGVTYGKTQNTNENSQ